MKFRKLMIACLSLALLLSLTIDGAYAKDKEFDLYKPGAVYTMSNCYCNNSILVFRRSAKGILSPDGEFPTGGSGTGGGLGNQSGLILSHDGQWLFACNAGSNDISVFRVTPKGLCLTDKVYSYGKRPISLALHKGLLFVLNAGGLVGCEDNVTGFLFHKGKLYHLAGSTMALSGVNTDPAQVGFSQHGKVLIVTEKETNIIDTFEVGCFNLCNHQIFMSPGQTPFGFAFRRDIMFLCEAFGGSPDASSLSSLKVLFNGSLLAIDPSVPTTETATCWVVVTKNGRYAYVSNTGSNSITGFKIDKCGNLMLLNGDGVTGSTGMGSAPIDLALSVNSHFLYSLNSGNGTIGAFKIKQDGSLCALPGICGIPTCANGLAAH